MTSLTLSAVFRCSCGGVGLLMVAWAPSIHAWPSTALRLPAPAEARPPGMLLVERGVFFLSEEGGSLLQRQREFNGAHQRATIVVYPVRIGNSVDTECAVNLAQLLPVADVCRACAVARPVVLPGSAPKSNARALWNLARAFREQVRKYPSGGDYALYVEYAHRPECDEWSFVRLVLCDAAGDWVFVDQQDLQPPEYRGVEPADKHDCDDLVVRRLAGFLSAAADRPAIGALPPGDHLPTDLLAPQPVRP